ncbi:MAG: 50S ribosomal protein L28 [Candidatus Humimicrobiaceae bacterium]|jgi:large subunit ribosomal protein L28|nr:50S ribosomal protein L28 [Candidatus Humimicrobiaceae bacterium]
MSRSCEICGKKTSFGNMVSRSHKKTRRAIKPNIQKAKVEYKGQVKTINICASCLVSGKVKKVV